MSKDSDRPKVTFGSAEFGGPVSLGHTEGWERAMEAYSAGALITARHDERAAEVHRMCSAESERVGMDVHAEITYAPGETMEALAAVERLAQGLRRQIADAAERNAP